MPAFSRHSIDASRMNSEGRRKPGSQIALKKAAVPHQGLELCQQGTCLGRLGVGRGPSSTQVRHTMGPHPRAVAGSTSPQGHGQDSRPRAPTTGLTEQTTSVVIMEGKKHTSSRVLLSCSQSRATSPLKDWGPGRWCGPPLSSSLEPQRTVGVERVAWWSPVAGHPAGQPCHTDNTQPRPRPT